MRSGATLFPAIDARRRKKNRRRRFFRSSVQKRTMSISSDWICRLLISPAGDLAAARELESFVETVRENRGNRYLQGCCRRENVELLRHKRDLVTRVKCSKLKGIAVKK